MTVGSTSSSRPPETIWLQEAPCRFQPRLPSMRGSMDRPAGVPHMSPGSSMISRAIRRRGARSTCSRSASRLSQGAGPPEGAAASGSACARVRAAMSRAAVCLQSLPTGHEQVPAQDAGALRAPCLRKTMVW